MKYDKESNTECSRIPIVILGRCDIHIQAQAGGIGCGGFWGKGLGTSVEEGIESAISGVKQNARVYLKLLSENRAEHNKDEEIAKRIISCNALEDLFKIVYFDHNRNEVEPHLGRFSSLERDVPGDFYD